MKVNKNLLVGLGIGLLAYYLYIRSKKKVEQPALEQTKGGGVVLPASTTNNNKPNPSLSLNELAAKAPTTLPNNIFSNPTTNKISPKERECERIYMLMPKPKVVGNDEYWARHKDNFMKKCIADNYSSRNSRLK